MALGQMCSGDGDRHGGGDGDEGDVGGALGDAGVRARHPVDTPAAQRRADVGGEGFEGVDVVTHARRCSPGYSPTSAGSC